MFDLESFSYIEKSIDFIISEDISKIIKRMNNEEIDLAGWKLSEIPIERVYCFHNLKRNEAFDYELDIRGNMMPHYYKTEKNTTITKHPTKTIKEAIKKYSL